MTEQGPVDINTGPTKTVSFSHGDFLIFKQRYNKAIEKNYTNFSFKGHTFLTSYAKYLIEFLSDKFK